MSKKPNLLFIFTDEQAAKTMKSYGNNLIDTPNMDRLANQSLIFENAYVSQPVCTPSRATLLTGLYPHTNKCIENNVPLTDDTKCFPELADFKEYKTAYYGKWHLGDEVFAQHGFEDWRSIEDYYIKYYSEGKDKKKISDYSQHLMDKGYKPDKTSSDGISFFSREFAAALPEELSKPMYLANEIEKFLDENKENPFIMFLNFFEPHMPYTGPRNDQYDLDDIPLPDNYYEGKYDTGNRKLNMFRRKYVETGHQGFELKDDEGWKRVIANYWGLVSLVDTALGKVLDNLERNGLMDNTIIVYTSDHGDMLGAHRLLAKCVMNEEAVKVPFMLKLPEIKDEGIKISKPVSQIDLIPTLLEAMGKDIPSFLEGSSLLPALEIKKDIDEKDVFIEWNGANNGFGDIIGGFKYLDCWKDRYTKDEVAEILGDPIRTIITPDNWKYNHSKYGHHELFNLNDDPYETKNLAGQPEHSSLIESLKSRIRNWQKNTSDTIDLI